MAGRLFTYSFLDFCFALFLWSILKKERFFERLRSFEKKKKKTSCNLPVGLPVFQGSYVIHGTGVQMLQN